MMAREMFGPLRHVRIYPTKDSYVSADARRTRPKRKGELSGRDDVGSPFFSRNGNAIGTGAGEHARFCQGTP